MAQSNIEWTECTWNPVTGCTKISKGCKFCYAEVMAKRLQSMSVEKYKDGFNVRTHAEALKIPYTWKKSKMVFVNSMSDLFHEKIPFAFITQVFEVMNDNPKHVFQVLTKRSERLLELHKKIKWTSNIWMGVTVEDKKNGLPRINQLREVNADKRFLSIEPLLEDIGEIDLTDIHWVIVGGESGHRPRPMKREWVVDIQRQCKRADVKFFFKQWGGRNKKKNGRLLNGRTYDDMPTPNTNSVKTSAIGLPYDF